MPKRPSDSQRDLVRSIVQGGRVAHLKSVARHQSEVRWTESQAESMNRGPSARRSRKRSARERAKRQGGSGSGIGALGGFLERNVGRPLGSALDAIGDVGAGAVNELSLGLEWADKNLGDWDVFRKQEQLRLERQAALDRQQAAKNNVYLALKTDPTNKARLRDAINIYEATKRVVAEKPKAQKEGIDVGRFAENVDKGKGISEYRVERGLDFGTAGNIAFDVGGSLVSDPLNLLVGAGAVSGGARAAVGLMKSAKNIDRIKDSLKVAEGLDDAAATLRATEMVESGAAKVLRHGTSALNRSEMKTLLGTTGGAKIARTGITVIPQEITHTAVQALRRPLGALRRLGDTGRLAGKGLKAGQAVDTFSGKYGKVLNAAMRSGDVRQANDAFDFSRTVAWARSNKNGRVNTYKEIVHKAIRGMKREDLDDLADGLASGRAVEGFSEQQQALRNVMDELEQAARLSGIKFGKIENYLPLFRSDALTDVVGKAARRGRGKAGFQHARMSIGDEFLTKEDGTAHVIGEGLDDAQLAAAQAGDNTLIEQEKVRIAQEVFGDEYVDLYNTNLEEIMPRFIDMMAKRIERAELIQALKGKGIVRDTVTGAPRRVDALAKQVDDITKRIAKTDEKLKTNIATSLQIDEQLAEARAATAAAEDALNSIPPTATTEQVEALGNNARLARAEQTRLESGIDAPHPAAAEGKLSANSTYEEIRDAKYADFERRVGRPPTRKEKKPINVAAQRQADGMKAGKAKVAEKAAKRTRLEKTAEASDAKAAAIEDEMETLRADVKSKPAEKKSKLAKLEARAKKEAARRKRIDKQLAALGSDRPIQAIDRDPSFRFQDEEEPVVPTDRSAGPGKTYDKGWAEGQVSKGGEQTRKNARGNAGNPEARKGKANLVDTPNPNVAERADISGAELDEAARRYIGYEPREAGRGELKYEIPDDLLDPARSAEARAQRDLLERSPEAAIDDALERRWDELGFDEETKQILRINDMDPLVEGLPSRLAELTGGRVHSVGDTILVNVGDPNDIGPGVGMFHPERDVIQPDYVRGNLNKQKYGFEGAPRELPKTVKGLKHEAKKAGIPGWSKMNKAQLQEALGGEMPGRVYPGRAKGSNTGESTYTVGVAKGDRTAPAGIGTEADDLETADPLAQALAGVEDVGDTTLGAGNVTKASLVEEGDAELRRIVDWVKRRTGADIRFSVDEAPPPSQIWELRQQARQMKEMRDSLRAGADANPHLAESMRREAEAMDYQMQDLYDQADELERWEPITLPARNHVMGQEIGPDGVPTGKLFMDERPAVRLEGRTYVIDMSQWREARRAAAQAKPTTAPGVPVGRFSGPTARVEAEEALKAVQPPFEERAITSGPFDHLPKVEEGNVRLYHGQGDGRITTDTDSIYFTDNPETAAAYGDDVQYMDVPQSQADQFLDTERKALESGESAGKEYKFTRGPGVEGRMKPAAKPEKTPLDNKPISDLSPEEVNDEASKAFLREKGYDPDTVTADDVDPEDWADSMAIALGMERRHYDEMMAEVDEITRQSDEFSDALNLHYADLSTPVKREADIWSGEAGFGAIGKDTWEQLDRVGDAMADDDVFTGRLLDQLAETSAYDEATDTVRVYRYGDEGRHAKSRYLNYSLRPDVGRNIGQQSTEYRVPLNSIVGTTGNEQAEIIVSKAMRDAYENAAPTSTLPEMADAVQATRPDLAPGVDNWYEFAEANPRLVPAAARDEILSHPKEYTHDAVVAASKGNKAAAELAMAFERAYGPAWRDSVELADEFDAAVRGMSQQRRSHSPKGAGAPALPPDPDPEVNELARLIDETQPGAVHGKSKHAEERYMEAVEDGDEEASALWRAAMEEWDRQYDVDFGRAQIAALEAAAKQTEAKLAKLSTKRRTLFEEVGKADQAKVAQVMANEAADGMKKLLLDPDVMAPEQIADALNLMGKAYEPGGFEKFLDTYWNPVVGWLKAFQTATPGFHFRNMIGDAFNNWLADVNVSSYNAWHRIRKANKEWHELGGSWGRLGSKLNDQEKEIAEAIRFADLHGAHGTQFLDLEKISATQKFNPLSRKGPLVRLSSHVGGKLNDAPHRGAQFVDVMLKGGSAEEAVAAVQKFHFDYSDLSDAERNLRRIVPFYTWTRHNLPLQVEMALLKPSKLARYNTVRENVQKNSPYADQVVPEYITKGAWGGFRTPLTVGEGESVYQGSGALPGHDLDEAFDDPVSKFAGMLTPALAVPIEHQRQKRFFKGFEMAKGEEEVPPTYRWMLPVLGNLPDGVPGKATQHKDGKWYMKKAHVDSIGSLFPLLARVRRLAANEEKTQARASNAWLSMLFGTGAYVNTKDLQQRELRSRGLTKAFSEKDAIESIPYEDRTDRDWDRYQRAQRQIRRLMDNKGPRIDDYYKAIR